MKRQSKKELDLFDIPTLTRCITALGRAIALAEAIAFDDESDWEDLAYLKAMGRALLRQRKIAKKLRI